MAHSVALVVENDISHRGLVSVAKTLSKGNCWQLHQLNLTRNLELRSVVVFQEVRIRTSR